MGCDLRGLRQHRHVGVSDLETAFAQHGEHRGDKAPAIRPSPAWVGIAEMLTDIAEASRTEQRITQRVQHDVAVGMRHHAARMGNAHSSQHEEVTGSESVDVEA